MLCPWRRLPNIPPLIWGIFVYFGARWWCRAHGRFETRICTGQWSCAGKSVLNPEHITHRKFDWTVVARELRLPDALAARGGVGRHPSDLIWSLDGRVHVDSMSKICGKFFALNNYACSLHRIFNNFFV